MELVILFLLTLFSSQSIQQNKVPIIYSRSGIESVSEKEIKLPHIKFGRSTAKAENCVFEKENELHSDINSLPVFQVHYKPASLTEAKQFAEEHFGITGEFSLVEKDGKEHYRISNNEWILEYTPPYGNIVVKKAKFYIDKTIEKNKNNSERIQDTNRYHELGREFLIEHKIFEDTMENSYLGYPLGCDVSDKDCTVLSVAYKRSLGDLIVSNSSIGVLIDITFYGEIVKLEYFWPQVSSIGEYPLKDPNKAYSEFIKGSGEFHGVTDASTESYWGHNIVREVTVGYFGPVYGEEYIQPVYVFIGKGAPTVRQRVYSYPGLLGFSEAIDNKYYRED